MKSDKSITNMQMISNAPVLIEAYDTTTIEFEKYLNDIDDFYQHQHLTYEQLDEMAREHQRNTLGFRVALKIAESRRIIRELRSPITITLLNPVYKETGRMQPREKHPHGEDSIRYKIKILREIESLNENLTTRFVVIDDECPYNSGEIAENILQEYVDEYNSGKYRVLFLKTAIDKQDSDLPYGLTHKDGRNRSVKGGAILYGMQKTVFESVEGLHILVDNDADLSIHPAQLGILLEDILIGKSQAVAGSRREVDSVAVIGSSRNARGKLFIQIWQHFLPQLADIITDTNRAFKAFTSKALKMILNDIRIYTFPYQIELLQACISNSISLTKRGIAYIDSEAASTQQGANITETYLNQIKQIIDISQRYNTISSDDNLLKFFLSVSKEDWQAIENNPPNSLGELVD